MFNLCTICMRGGSKGVPKKNLKKLIDKPLLAYTITQALESKIFDKVVISTDSLDIANESKKYGAESWFIRSKELADDKSAKVPVIRDALLKAESYYKKTFSYIFDLDATSPLRDVDDIINAFNYFLDEKSDNLVSACISKKNPYFNVLEYNSGEINTSKKMNNKILRRQDAPITYDMNASIYIWKRNYLINSDNLFSKNTSLYIMPEERSIDIDSQLDWDIVEYLIKRKNK